MALHDFMLKRALGVQTLESLSPQHTAPSELYTAINPQARCGFSGAYGAFSLDDYGVMSDMEGMNKAQRHQIWQKGLFANSQVPFAVDMEDARYTPSTVTFGAPRNIFQYNRRKGDKYAVLWRLPSYFEPSPSLGHPSRGGIADATPFPEKINKVIWRGGPNSSRWKDPFHRVGIPQMKTLQDLERVSPKYSRLSLVLKHRDSKIVDARFTKRTLDRFSWKHLPDISAVTADHVSPDELLKYKYILCPAGNDVSSALYWIIGTNSIPLVEETSYEVVPDYFLEPWVHYVPLAPGMHDLQEKFEYLETHPDLANAIIDASHEVYKTLTTTPIWESAELTVLERLNILK